MAVFKKCDLHIHSCSCGNRDYTEDEFLAKILDTDFDVIAITDHNTIDLNLLGKINDLFGSMGRFILPGIEVNVILPEQTIKDYDLYVDEEAGFFQAILWFNYDDAEKALRCFTDLIATKYKPISEQIETLTPKQLSKAMDAKVFEFEDIRNAFRTLDHFFIFHENKGDRNLSDYLPNTEKGKANNKQRKNNEQFKENLLYYNDSLAVEGGKKSRIISKSLEELNSVVSCFFCSDPTTIDEIGRNYTWIAFDGSLDSLNLAITDPDSRIATSDEVPNNPQNNESSYLESIKIPLLNEKEIKLSFTPGYNGIVGSRGSGKSMLANVLAKGQSEISAYDDIVDHEKIEYKMVGGGYSRDVPSCLYLRQHGLQTIFEDGGYKKIPFLSTRLEPLEQSSKAALAKLEAEIISRLDEEQKQVVAFLSKYGNVLVYPDFLDSPKPSGFQIELFNEAEYPDVYSQAKVISKFLDDTIESLNETISELEEIEIDDCYPEFESTHKKIVDSVDKLIDGFIENKKALVELKTLLEGEGVSQVKLRKELIHALLLSAKRANKDFGADLASYVQKEKNLVSFLEDYFALRLFISKNELAIQELHKNMMKPINPEVFPIGEDEEAIISLEFENQQTYDEIVASNFTGSFKNEMYKIDRVCLFASDKKALDNVFNGVKYKNCSNGLDYISKYYEHLKKGVTESRKMNIELSHNGKTLSAMSPGMQAQILLRLFLHDSILKNEYTYIVLDQPEDNLDTQTISTFLLKSIRDLKRTIQVFVISHSASLIINGDAHTVTVCKEKSSHDFEYNQGPINDKNIKGDIADILDGGEKHLKMRLNKYNFKIGEASAVCE